MLLSIMSCSTDSQNEDDVNYLSSYSNNEDGNIDENNDCLLYTSDAADE